MIMQKWVQNTNIWFSFFNYKKSSYICIIYHPWCDKVVIFERLMILIIILEAFLVIQNKNISHPRVKVIILFVLHWSKASKCCPNAGAFYIKNSVWRNAGEWNEMIIMLILYHPWRQSQFKYEFHILFYQSSHFVH